MAEMISRSNAAALIPDEVSRQIIDGVRAASVALGRMRKLPNMSSGTSSMPVLSLLPIADFVNGDSGMKITTNAAWDKKTLTAGEVAAIVPVPQAVLDDADYNVWGEIRPLIIEAMGRVIDRQIFSARNAKAPLSWPNPLIPAAIAAGNTVTATADPFRDFSRLLGVMESQEYDATGMLLQRSLKQQLREYKSTDGFQLYQPLTGEQPAMVYGVPSEFIKPGTWDRTLALAIAGEWDKAVYSIRQDITFQIFDTGVISDEDGKVVYNLLQQDMVAMRVVMRLAWQVANPIDIDRAYGTGFPFAILVPGTIQTIGSAAYKVTTPVKAATAQTTHDAGTGYTATVAWSPAPTAGAFDADAAFTATVEFTAAAGYLFESDFSADDVTGLPTTGASGVATSVTVTRNSSDKVTVVAVYKKTAA